MSTVGKEQHAVVHSLAFSIHLIIRRQLGALARSHKRALMELITC